MVQRLSLYGWVDGSTPSSSQGCSLLVASCLVLVVLASRATEMSQFVCCGMSLHWLRD